MDIRVFRGARKTRVDQLYIQKGLKYVGFWTVRLEVSDHLLLQVSALEYGHLVWEEDSETELKVLGSNEW